jgi:hypothetical protein
VWRQRRRTRRTAKTLCPSGLRGRTQVPLARAAWVQIPQVSFEPNASHVNNMCPVVIAFGMKSHFGCHYHDSWGWQESVTIIVDHAATRKQNAETRDRTGDLQIFSLTLSQLSYRGSVKIVRWENIWSACKFLFSALNIRRICSPRFMKRVKMSDPSLECKEDATNAQSTWLSP